LEPAKECVTTHRPNVLALKIDHTYSGLYRYAAGFFKKLCKGACFKYHNNLYSRAVQILVGVAMFKFTLKVGCRRGFHGYIIWP